MNSTDRLAKNIDLCLKDAETMVQMAIDEVLLSTQEEANKLDVSLACVVKLALAGVQSARSMIAYITNHLSEDE